MKDRAWGKMMIRNQLWGGFGENGGRTFFKGTLDPLSRLGLRCFSFPTKNYNFCIMKLFLSSKTMAENIWPLLKQVGPKQSPHFHNGKRTLIHTPLYKFPLVDKSPDISNILYMFNNNTNTDFRTASKRISISSYVIWKN